MSFPPAHVLVGMGAAETASAYTGVSRWRAWLLGGVLGVLPDGDIVLGIATGSASAYHGTFTHSLVAVAVVALLGWMAAGPAWGAVAGAGYGSHLLVDLLDGRGATNVLLAWPFTDARPASIARLFPPVSFEQGSGIWRAALSLLEPAAVRALLAQSLLAAGLLLAALGLAWVVRRSGRFP